MLLPETEAEAVDSLKAQVSQKLYQENAMGVALYSLPNVVDEMNRYNLVYTMRQGKPYLDNWLNIHWA